MALGRSLVRGGLTASLLVGCDGEVVVVEPPRPPLDDPPACVTSFGCGASQLCYEGECIDESGCPPALEPQVLFDDATWPGLASKASFYAVAGPDAEYLVETFGISADSVPPGEHRFIVLGTGQVTSWSHAPAFGGCGSGFALCEMRNGEARWAAFDLRREPGATHWAPTAIIDNWPQGDWSYIGRLGGLELAERPGELGTIDMATGSVEPLLSLGDWTRLNYLLPGAEGSLRMVGTQVHQGQATVSVGAISLSKGAAWEVLVDSMPGWALATPIPEGDGYLFVHAVYEEHDSWKAHFVPTVGAIPELVSSGTGTLVPQAAHRHALAGAPLYDGRRALGIDCDEAGCRSRLLDVDDGSMEIVSEIAIDGPGGIFVRQEKWLSCGAVEAIVRVRPVSGEIASSYVTFRLAGRAGL